MEPLDDTAALQEVTTTFQSPPPNNDVVVRGETEIQETDNNMAKLVHTVSFIKRWSQTYERPTGSAVTRSEFMHRHGYFRGEPADSAGESDWVAVQTHRRNLHLSPTSRYLYWWTFIVALFVLYETFIIIARQTFEQLHGTKWGITIWVTIDVIADLVFLIDIIIQFKTAYLEKGLVVTDSRKMARHYIKSVQFKLDILASLPFDYILLFIPAISFQYTIIRANRLLKLHRMQRFFDQTDSSTNYPNVFRLFTLLLYLFFIVHWNACFYFLISKSIGFGQDRWVYPMMESYNWTESADEYSNLFTQYIVSFYWSTLTLTTIGELPGPVTDGEYVFVIMDFLIGVLIFATIIGLVSEIITNMNAQRDSFQSRLDNVKNYMKKRRVGKDLQKRVIKWFDYLWTNKTMLDEQEILNLLPDKLHAEISIHVNFELLSKVSIFEQCEAGLLEELVLKLKPQVYSPGDYVCRKGDIGKEMFIIKQGKLHVVDDNGHVLATLDDGSYFGEISVLNLSVKGNRRTANVRSVGFSDLYCLAKSDLLEVLEDYPEAKAMMAERGRMTLKHDRDADESLTSEDAVIPPIETDPTGNGGGCGLGGVSRWDSLDQRLRQLEDVVGRKGAGTHDRPAN